MMTRHLRKALYAALAGYIATLIVIAVWPTRVDKPVDDQLRVAINSAHSAGAPRHLGYSLIENVANGALFVPLGILLALVIAAARWWIAPILCLALSTILELTQYYYIAGRTGTITDVVSNTVGGLVGATFVLAFRAIRTSKQVAQTRRSQLDSVAT